MKNDVNPAQEGMTQRPKDAVIDVPAKQCRENRTDAAKNTTAATPTSRLFVVFSHVYSILASPSTCFVKRCGNANGSEYSELKSSGLTSDILISGKIR